MNKEFFPKTLDLPIEMTDDEHNVESEEEVDELSQDKVSDQHTNKYEIEGEIWHPQRSTTICTLIRTTG